MGGFPARCLTHTRRERERGDSCRNGVQLERERSENLCSLYHVPCTRRKRACHPSFSFSGMRKIYWITCNVEPDIQHLSLDRTRFPSSLVVRPRDLNRLLANFQSSLQEITIIATEPTSLPSDAASEIGGKAVELRSYIDPTKENDSSLHTQLWIDPTEEFVQYTHTGDPVDVTFGVKELKAFLSFCEGCEVDIHLFFEKAGEPILMAPKFGLDDGSSSNFDAALVLATMLVSQLHEGNPLEHPPVAGIVHDQANHGRGSQAQEERPGVNVSEHPSDHTRIWSELSGSAAKSNSGAEGRQVRGERNPTAVAQGEIERISTMQISKAGSARGNVPGGADFCSPAQAPQVTTEVNDHGLTQRHPSNWVDLDEGGDDDNDDDEGVENELCVQATPPYYEEQ
ncbi:uncharacterized protein LOC131154293 isoform X2 [Malania oleifera]|uniref:uncharacterized protein LOC131154293 isoform X2 n=1 Tax=Malania oleifera TaxID=397392 RepID=UPI0025ADC19D|nr:uncharacterized protein LOC131154293 isoform X2 [Malania oleifera]